MQRSDVGPRRVWLGYLCLSLILSVGADPLRAQAHDGHARPAREKLPATWSQLPLLQAAGRSTPDGLPFSVSGMAADELRVLASGAPAVPITYTAARGRWMVKPQAGGGFHWLETVQQSPEFHYRASTAWAFPGHGTSPEGLLRVAGEGLEIRPLLLPERGGFREGSTWRFKVLMHGQAVFAAPVLLETENGTRQHFSTDGDGIVQIVFPRDYRVEMIDSAQGAARTRKGFLLSSSVTRDEVRHLTTFSNFYTPDLLRERSVAWGAAFALLGGLLAVPLLRRKEKKS